MDWSETGTDESDGRDELFIHKDAARRMRIAVRTVRYSENECWWNRPSKRAENAEPAGGPTQGDDHGK